MNDKKIDRYIRKILNDPPLFHLDQKEIKILNQRLRQLSDRNFYCSYKLLKLLEKKRPN